MRMTKHEQSVHTFNTPPSQVTPILSSGPTHCHPHHCAYCVRYHKVTLSTVRCKAVCTTQQVFCPERSTAQTSMNTPGAQTYHTTASHLIEHTHTHGAILHQHRNRRKCSTSHANSQAHIALLSVTMESGHSHCIWSIPREEHETNHTTAEPEHHILNKEHNTYTKQPNIVHAVQAHPLQSLHCGRHC